MWAGPSGGDLSYHFDRNGYRLERNEMRPAVTRGPLDFALLQSFPVRFFIAKCERARSILRNMVFRRVNPDKRERIKRDGSV